MIRYAVALTLLAIPVAVAQEAPRTITIEATGVAIFEPEIFHIVLSAESLGETREAAAQAIEETATRILDGVRRMEGLESLSIETSNFSIDRTCADMSGYGSTRPPCRVTGYRATQQFSLRGSPVTLAGNMASLGGDLGAHSAEIRGYSLGDRDAARLEAQRNAVIEAQARAAGIAAALGYRLGSVRSVQPVQEDYYAHSVELRSPSADSITVTGSRITRPEVPMTVEPGPVRVQERLAITFELSLAEE